MITDKEIESILFKHVLKLKFHSSRDNDGKFFTWNTPIKNEFVAFGKLIYKKFHSEIEELKKEIEMDNKIIEEQNYKIMNLELECQR